MKIALRYLALCCAILLPALSLTAFQNIDEESGLMITNPADATQRSDDTAGMITRSSEASSYTEIPAEEEAGIIVRDSANEAAAAADSSANTILNPMTGLPAENPSLLSIPPVFVPMVRIPSAYRPTSGMSQAPWVFEMYVSGGESRPVLMFYGNLPTVDLYHISSAFIGLESLRLQYNGILITGGSSQEVLKNLKNTEIWYGSNGNEIYPKLPADAYQRILNKWVKRATPADQNNLRYTFSSDVPQDGQDAQSVYLRYADSNRILWQYDAGTGQYYRSQNSVESPQTLAADVDTSNGEQIAVENIIILMARHNHMQGAGYYDVTLNYVEEEAGYAFRDGKVYPIRWSSKSDNFERESNRMRPIRFTNPDGSNYTLKPGHTWVHVMTAKSPFYEVDESLGSVQTEGTGYWLMPYVSYKPEDEY